MCLCSDSSLATTGQYSTCWSILVACRLRHYPPPLPEVLACAWLLYYISKEVDRQADHHHAVTATASILENSLVQARRHGSLALRDRHCWRSDFYFLLSPRGGDDGDILAVCGESRLGTDKGYLGFFFFFFSRWDLCFW